MGLIFKVTAQVIWTPPEGSILYGVEEVIGEDYRVLDFPHVEGLDINADADLQADLIDLQLAQLTGMQNDNVFRLLGQNVSASCMQNAGDRLQEIRNKILENRDSEAKDANDIDETIG